MAGAGDDEGGRLDALADERPGRSVHRLVQDDDVEDVADLSHVTICHERPSPEPGLLEVALHGAGAGVDRQYTTAEVADAGGDPDGGAGAELEYLAVGL